MTKQEQRRNIADLMAKAYNWLYEYWQKNKTWFAFQPLTEDAQCIFPEKGWGNPPGFYCNLVKLKNKCCVQLRFGVADFKEINKISFYCCYTNDGQVVDFYKHLSDELKEGNNYNKVNFQPGINDEEIKKELFRLLDRAAEKFKNIDPTRKIEMPRDGERHEEITKLIEKGFLEYADNGELVVPQDAQFSGDGDSDAELEENEESLEMDKNIGDKMIEEIRTLLKSSRQVILTGAPGTGKTYLAKKVALAMLGEQYTDKDWDKAFMDGRVGFCQFHPSYDYSDFVEGLRPVTVGNGENAQVGFKRMDGVFKDFCKNALRGGGTDWNAVFEKAWNCLFSLIEKAPKERIEIPLISGRGTFPLALNEPGTGLASRTYDEADKDWVRGASKFFTREQIFNVFRGLPGVPSGGHDSYRKAIVDYMKKECGLVEYVKDNADKQSDAERPYVFIIDEINRGDISKIFGELFFSIDPAYRGTDGLVKTQYQNLVEPGDVFAKGFYVPENVYIIGTMNDIDRSVESMDFAIRRRFVWKEVEPNLAALYAKKDGKSETDESRYIIAKEEDRDKAEKCMENLNKKICESNLLGSAYAVGQAYFLKLDSVDGFDALWKMNLEPLLREYLRGNPKQVIDDKIKEFKEAYDLGWKERVEGEVTR